jgi:hypothetical protein
MFSVYPILWPHHILSIQPYEIEVEIVVDFETLEKVETLFRNARVTANLSDSTGNMNEI